MEQLSMSFFLSLARGDFEARNLLKEAVLARYAARPVPLEKLRLTLRRQARIWLGVPLKSSSRRLTLSLINGLGKSDTSSSASRSAVSARRSLSRPILRCARACIGSNGHSAR
jgi:hypothetical protein